MGTSNLSFGISFQPTNSVQPSYAGPLSALTFAGQAAGNLPQTILLPAAGTSYTLPVPSFWTHVEQVIVQNLDQSGQGYVVLNTNATSGAPCIQLETAGGLFACSFGTGLPSGSVAPNPKTWTLQTCDVNGVTANGQATYVYIYLAGS